MIRKKAKEIHRTTTFCSGKRKRILGKEGGGGKKEEEGGGGGGGDERDDTRHKEIKNLHCIVPFQLIFPQLSH